MRCPGIGNAFRIPLRFRGLCAEAGGRMLVAFVQRVVRTFDKDFSPLNEAGREETGDHTKNDFLDEGRVHWPVLGSRTGASERASPKAPLPRFHDPKPQEEIGHGVGQNAGGQAFGPVGDAIIKCAGDERCDPVLRRVGESEPEGDHDK
ncbi:MAG: hypothetical protein QOD12_943 [Verrucomicrobiota bacterium]